MTSSGAILGSTDMLSTKIDTATQDVFGTRRVNEAEADGGVLC